MTARFRRNLLDHATRPYRTAGHFAWRFARGKLKGDPVFFGLLEHGLLPDGERLIDLGCGQGLLASWLREAHALFESGDWPQGWPPSLQGTSSRTISATNTTTKSPITPTKNPSPLTGQPPPRPSAGAR